MSRKSKRINQNKNDDIVKQNLELKETIEVSNRRIKELEKENRILKAQLQQKQPIIKQLSTQYSSNNAYRELFETNNILVNNYNTLIKQLEHEKKILEDACIQKELDKEILLKRIDALTKQFTNQFHTLQSELEKKSNALILAQQKLSVCKNNKETQVDDNSLKSEKSVEHLEEKISFNSNQINDNDVIMKMNQNDDKTMESPPLYEPSYNDDDDLPQDGDSPFLRMYKESFCFWKHLKNVDNWDQK
ncbi:hypothetical protein PVAND_014093 [Polypedilum vanderplanki]|uniref:Uncharacterized protein n=1 Tax=Polypedilum vanderplanki TaxID=319348 RepID=A0A9J6CTD1_POLVA|nr:hypothetical protein PVAND_014093 [Polypedilum vanderplanki]